MFPSRGGYIPGVKMPSLTWSFCQCPYHGFPECLSHHHGNLHSTDCVTCKDKFIHMEFTSVTMYPDAKKQLNQYSLVVFLVERKIPAVLEFFTVIWSIYFESASNIWSQILLVRIHRSSNQMEVVITQVTYWKNFWLLYNQPGESMNLEVFEYLRK